MNVFDEARSGWAELSAGRFHYLAYGDPDGTLPAALLLHANAGSARDWGRIAAALAGGSRVYALDLRGHGASPRPAPGGYAPSAAARDVLEFLDALGLDDVVLVGHSWGAAVALAAVVDVSGRARRISGLALLDPPPELSTGRLGTRLDTLQRLIAMPPERLRAAVTAACPDWHPEDVDAFTESLGAADPEVAAAVVADGAAAGSLLPLLAEVPGPLLLLRADPDLGGLLEDADWSAATAFAPPGSTLLDLPGVPHEIYRSAPATLLAALAAYLATLRGAGLSTGRSTCPQER